MSNLFKKVTSAVAGLAIAFSIVSPIAGVNAVYTQSLDAANKLASVGVINDSSANPANYRLGDNISRREMIKVAMNLASCQNVELNDTFAGKFSDVPASDWAWKYAETAVDNSFVAANAMFYPSRNVTKSESLKMVMNSTEIEKATGGANFWADYVAGGVDAGIVESFSDYDMDATRGWIFKVAANALEEGSCGADTTDDDLLDDLLDGLDDDTTDTGATDDTTDDTVGGDGTLTISLSAETPDAATVPANISGLPVAAYDLTAGAEDVTVTSITVRRKGLSDDKTLTAVAAFTEDGRVSKGKDDSQNNDTEALLTLTNGLVIKAGETVTLWLVTDINSIANGVTHDEFALEVVEVVASADVEADGSLVANTMKVGAVEAAQIEVKKSTSVADVNLGDEGADIFKFEVKGSPESDVILKSVTFKSVNSDAEDNLMNFELVYANNVVASTAEMNGKYVTFNLGDGVTIAKSKTEKFTVRADVVSGAADTLEFYVDKQLDVTGIDTKYGYGSSVNITAVDTSAEMFDSVKINAGELTLVDIDADSDEIKEDKDGVVLGKIKVTNVAGSNLELQQFGVKVVLTPGTSFEDLDDDGIDDGGSENAGLKEYLDNFELYNEDTGASYELDDPTVASTLSHVYSDNDLNIELPVGVTTFTLRADTRDNIANFDTTKFALNTNVGAVGANGGFYVVETDDDTLVTDITPNVLTWNSVDGSESGGRLSLLPLSAVNAVRGANDVEAMKFEIKADKSSDLIIDELDIKVLANGVNATAQQISQAALYKGSISEANLLDNVSGSSVGSNAGVAGFDGFSVTIPAGQTQVFVVALGFVDGTDASLVGNQPYTVRILANTDVSAEDEDNDDITLSGTFPAISSRNITVTDVGQLVRTEDNNNADNKDTKTVLGGTSQKVFSADVSAINEDIDVETVVFTYAGGSIATAVVNASLYLGDTLIDTNANADIAAGTITFADLETLIIPQQSKELVLALNAATIGYQKVGATSLNRNITGVQLTDAKGVSSGKDVTTGVTNLAVTGKNFSIVPAVVTPSVVQAMSTSDRKLKVKFTVDDGSNTATADNSGVQVDLTQLTLTAGGTYTGDYKIYVDGNSGASATATVGGGQVVFTNVNLNATTNLGVVSTSETYVIEMVNTLGAGANASLTLTKNGIQYDAANVSASTGITSNLSSELELGSAVGN